jgi:pyruvate carboxylase subunit B
MIFAKDPKKIRVMFTPFRDGLQSSFGGKVRLNDFLPAMEASARAGFRHFEFGGGARYQAPYFYLGENPFEDMRKIRAAVGPDRNFDFMNDTENLVKTGQPIVDAGMHHQVCIALMGLPFESKTVHTPEFYINIGKKLLESGVHIDSICLKDASGTTDPKTIYDTARGLKKIMPPEMPLWAHTHDTASTAVACYMAAIDGGADGVDLSLRPLASGTVQPDARSLAHGLKGTGYSLDIDVSKLPEIESLMNEGFKDYDFNPTTTTADARVLGFPMPGGAIGPNVHMMVKAGILDKYSEVLAEFPIVVEAGGAWTSVTPGSQQYWLQAFNNVMYGRWKRIDAGYGRSVLGYFGKTPLPSDPDVVKVASEQLDMPVFEGDPLEAAPNNIGAAKEALEERGLPTTDENIFLVLAAMVPGKKMELNEGIRLLTGNSKIDIPLKKKEEPTAAPAAAAPAPGAAPAFTGPTTTRCTVEENGTSRTFVVTLEPATATESTAGAAAAPSGGTPVHSTFAGSMEVVDILVKEGEKVGVGAVVAAVEAMKAKHDIKSPVAGQVTGIHVRIGDEIDSSKPIMTIA